MMDIEQILELLGNQHPERINDFEAGIRQLHEHHVNNEVGQFRNILLDIGLLAPALALNYIGHLPGGELPGVGAAPVQPGPAPILGDGVAPVQPGPAPIPAPQPESILPIDLNNLIEIIENAVLQQNTIKAVGTSHSVEWTNIGHTQQPNGILIDMSELNDAIEINAAILNPEAQQMLENRMICCFEAGATLNRVQESLWPVPFRTGNPNQHRVLLNQTGCVDLSLSGTIATGAHGNGLTKPIIADMVLSFLLLTVNEKNEVVQNQIEPANGITNPVAFQAIHPERTLIQNDNTFNGALVNIGSMGIAYSYIMRTERAFYLTENRFSVTWQQAQDEIIPNLFDRNENDPEGEVGSLHSFEIFVNPYPVGLQNQVRVVICTLEYADGPPQGIRPEWHIIPPELVRLGFVLACDIYPVIVPDLLDFMMNCTTTNLPVTMNAVEALNPLSGLAVSGQVTVSECAMETQNAADVVDKIQALINLYQDIREEDQHQLASCPFAVRFSRPTNAYMAMQYNRQSMMIISNILVGTPNANDTLQQFRDLMQNDFNGRPHWGMVQDVDANNVGQIYPANNGVDPVDAFRNVMQQLDPNEIFRNQFINTVFFPGQNQ